MKVPLMIAIVISLTACKQSTEKQAANYEINWGKGSYFTCANEYDISDGFVTFYSPKSDENYKIPISSLDHVRTGCNYYQLTKHKNKSVDK